MMGRKLMMKEKQIIKSGSIDIAINRATELVRRSCRNTAKASW